MQREAKMPHSFPTAERSLSGGLALPILSALLASVAALNVLSVVLALLAA